MNLIVRQTTLKVNLMVSRLGNTFFHLLDYFPQLSTHFHISVNRGYIEDFFQ